MGICDRSKTAVDSKNGGCSCTVEIPNVFTRFYMGQKVKAHHHGQWYDARVITVKQPSVADLIATLAEFEKKHAEEIENGAELEMRQEGGELRQSASSWLNDQLEAHLKEMRCFVHYLGWNARYDVWAEPAKIKTLEKDQHTSEKAFLSFVPDKVGAATLDAAFAWRSSAVDSTITADALTCGDVLGFGSFRPRRISISHYEHHLTATSVVEGSSSSHTTTSSSGGVLAMPRASTESRGSATFEKRSSKKLARFSFLLKIYILNQRVPSLCGSSVQSPSSLSTMSAPSALTCSGVNLLSGSKNEDTPLAVPTSTRTATSVVPPPTTLTLRTDTIPISHTMPIVMLTTQGASGEHASMVHALVTDLSAQQLPPIIEVQPSVPVSVLSFKSVASTQSSNNPSAVIFTPSKTIPQATRSETAPSESLSAKQEELAENATTKAKKLVEADRNEVPKVTKRRRAVSEAGVHEEQSVTCDYSFINKNLSLPAVVSVPSMETSSDALPSDGVVEHVYKQVAVSSFESASFSVVTRRPLPSTPSTTGSNTEEVLPIAPEIMARPVEIKLEEEALTSAPTKFVETSMSALAIEREEETPTEKQFSVQHTSHSPTSEALKDKMTPSYTESVTNESEITGSETPARDVEEEGSHMVSLSGRSSTSSHRHHQKSITRGAKRKRHRNSSFMGGERRPGRPSRRTLEDEAHDSDEESGSDADGCPSPKDSMHALKMRMQQKMETENICMADVEKEFELTPIDDSLTGEALIAQLQDRLQELRDMYHNVRSEQAQLDRRWRKTNEKRKQREKELKLKEDTISQSISEETVH
ncbi:unnamed protein product [Toxocara canis]|uniref:Chromo domain-containing protein n=1 Tax=Toxocara canis TaxID=6265 RepID=A0A183V8T4_TOXCA|nr:unnamed protein product [Toxocara canis]